jgi:hypothetical protein
MAARILKRDFIVKIRFILSITFPRNGPFVQHRYSSKAIILKLQG